MATEKERVALLAAKTFVMAVQKLGGVAPELLDDFDRLRRALLLVAPPDGQPEAGDQVEVVAKDWHRGAVGRVVEVRTVDATAVLVGFSSPTTNFSPEDRLRWFPRADLRLVR